jgi:MFS family permease
VVTYFSQSFCQNEQLHLLRNFNASQTQVRLPQTKEPATLPNSPLDNPVQDNQEKNSMSEAKPGPTILSNRGQLMWASFLTLIAAGMGFGVRAGCLFSWGQEFGFTQLELGLITGGGLTGFGLVILAASLIIDQIGYKLVLLLAFILHVVSVIVTLAATPIYEAMGKDPAFYCLAAGVFIFAVANGLCEAVINPLIANIYPEKKTHYLNILHAGWPAGLIVGGFLGYLFLTGDAKIMPLRWEIVLGLYLLPCIWYGIIVLKEAFPQTDVQKSGIGFGQMLLEFGSPLLLFILLLHACVGYVELGTDSWIANITNLITGQGFELFIYTSALMFALRFFAGPIVERINPLGLLCISTVFGTIGLVWLSSVTVWWMAWLAVTVYALGKTFLWPTMLGIVGERFPRGGALIMGCVGGVGMLSAGFLGGPGIGYKQDYYASKDLKEKSEPSFERYSAEKESGFLFFPKVKGLDNQKVATLLQTSGKDWTPAKTLNSDYEIFAERKEKDGEEIPKTLIEQKKWWESVGEPNKEVDRKPVGDAQIYGGRMALYLTAGVPAFMFFGYLILVGYFASKGGYTAVELTETGELREVGKHPSAEDAIEKGEEGPSSGQA